MQIKTDRLFLQAITPNDIQTLFESKAREEIMDALGCNEEGYVRYHQMFEKGMETFRISQLIFLLRNKMNNEIIGECGFHTWNSAHRRSEIYYAMLKEDEKRKGYMSEALPSLIRYGFEHMNLHRIEALIDDANAPSKRLLEKNGFTREGVVREDYNVDGKNEDSICYSLLRNEWG